MEDHTPDTTQTQQQSCFWGFLQAWRTLAEEERTAKTTLCVADEEERGRLLSQSCQIHGRKISSHSANSLKALRALTKETGSIYSFIFNLVSCLNADWQRILLDLSMKSKSRATWHSEGNQTQHKPGQHQNTQLALDTMFYNNHNEIKAIKPLLFCNCEI